ncbi:MAG TPA: type VI secretion system baseplate subunit TssG [Terriglobales bacterium]|jgi:type VI secretion system protein ImpH|nr:type VI secretion system baseplate subunit TssG [Terriglobales bacterium]
MASASGRTDPPLERVLFEEAFRFDFFQAVRLLERIRVQHDGVARGAIPRREVVRFRSRISLTFPPSAIHEIAEPADAEAPPEMMVAFMGLAGLLGVLPRHYTEMLLERLRQKDYTLRDFLDIFNHRFISLFYRAWEKYRYPVAYERAAQTRQRYDPFSRYLFDLIGLGTGGLRERLSVEGESVLFYSGLLAQKPHSASAIEAVLSDYFGVPVRTRQFVGKWLPLSAQDRTCLTTQRDASPLGSAILGARFWDQQAKFRFRVGPLNFDQFEIFLPTGKALGPFNQLARLFVGQEVDFDLQLVLKADEVPACRLAKPGSDALRLGWSSWLKTKEFTQDAEDTVLGSHWTRVGSSATTSL